MNLDNIIGTKEAAKILKISPDHVKKLCRDGKLPCKRIGLVYVLDKNLLSNRKDECK
jgi:excisionase family DNA binding protein